MVLSFEQQPHLSQSLDKNTGLGGGLSSNFSLRQNGHLDRSNIKIILTSWQNHPLYFLLPSSTPTRIHSSTQISLLTVSFRPLTTHPHLYFPFPRLHTRLLPTFPFCLLPSPHHPSASPFPVPSNAYRAPHATCSPQWHNALTVAPGGAIMWVSLNAVDSTLSHSSHWLMRMMSQQLRATFNCHNCSCISCIIFMEYIINFYKLMNH